MKKQFIFLTLTVILLAGCSSDSNSNSLPINEENLLGKWYSKGSTINNGTFQNYENNCLTSKDYMEIKIPHNINSYQHGTDCEISNMQTRVWTLAGDKLTIINPDPAVAIPYVYKVLNITEEQLVLSIDTHPISPTQTETYKYYYTRD